MDFGTTLLYLLVLVFSVVFHEVSHGWMADLHGDPTARILGRLTLNPLPHLDLWGSLLLPGMLVMMGSPILFGYAKPVPVNVANLRNPRVDGLKVAFAGPISNLVLALISAFGFLLAARALGPDHAVSVLFRLGLTVNCLLAIFNLLPIPPLDGSWVLDHTLPRQALLAYQRIKPFGILILLGILLVPHVSYFLIRLPMSAVAGAFLALAAMTLGIS
jgi:Zn-dependent protease